MPYFSVIIPLYNKEKYIENTLQTVLNQTFVDFEIIVVNDGSTDDSVKILKRFKSEKIKIIHQKNQGVSSARNTGMEHAQSEYFCFLDADDRWKPNHLAVLAQTILKFPLGKMFCSRYVTQINANTFTENTFIDIASEYEGYIADFFKSSYVNRIALTSAVCIKKIIFDEIGGFDESISSGQDLDYWIKIALNYQLVLTNKTTMVYNYKKENISLSKTNINDKTIPDFTIFSSFEKHNESLKRFLDLYRIEYALQYRVANNKNKSTTLLQNVNKKNIHFKTKLLFKLPPIVLAWLLKLKHFLKNKGVDFTVYH